MLLPQPAEAVAAELMWVQNFFDELKRLVPN